MRKVFEIGGIVAAAVLIAFGIAAIVMGVNGHSTVQNSLKLEQIVGSPDMTPAAIKAEAKKAGLNVANISFPTLAVAGKAINSGDRARAFAGYMRIHALEATGGLTYAQMGRFIAKPGTPAKFTDGHGATSDEKYALIDPKTQAAGRQRRPEPLGDRDGAHDRAQHELHGRAALAVRDRRRRRPAARRHRLRDPRHRRRAPESGDGVRLPAQEAARAKVARSRRRRNPPSHRDDGPPSGGPSSFSGRFEQPSLERVAHELGAAREPELLHDVRAVRLGRSHRDVELLRDLLVRVAEREQPQDLALAVGERVFLRARAARLSRPRRAARRAPGGRSAPRRPPRGSPRRPPCRRPP